MWLFMNAIIHSSDGGRQRHGKWIYTLGKVIRLLAGDIHQLSQLCMKACVYFHPDSGLFQTIDFFPSIVMQSCMHSFWLCVWYSNIMSKWNCLTISFLPQHLIQATSKFEHNNKKEFEWTLNMLNSYAFSKVLETVTVQNVFLIFMIEHE